MGKKQQPVNSIKWIQRDKLKPNNYNPNYVAPPELKLLKISIIEDGWTQPIVITPDYEIIDGFHRWTVSDDKKIREMTDGKVPVVITKPQDRKSQQMATIRHNRARGKHAVINMAEIISEMVDDGTSLEEISERLQMEKEEIIRLSIRKGIPETDIIKDSDWSKSWIPDQYEQ
tara:strand:+ start:2389 stop:2907 length:519 start_codon:yes stop_codon:yes gene_type:complete